MGDPALELSWIYLCTGKCIDVNELLKMYREEGGSDISEFRFRFHQVFHCIMMPITCVASLEVLKKRPDNINYALFGMLFMHYHTSNLIAAIEQAEAARNR